MNWQLEISPQFEKEFRKLCAKNQKFREEVKAKISQIRESPLRFKPLRQPLHGLRRVHVMGSYVIVYEPIAESHIVRLIRLAHHDEAYGY